MLDSSGPSFTQGVSACQLHEACEAGALYAVRLSASARDVRLRASARDIRLSLVMAGCFTGRGKVGTGRGRGKVRSFHWKR